MVTIIGNVYVTWYLAVNRPHPTSGMRHVALCVKDIEACETFYADLLGMTVEWHPDTDNIYLTSGNDNLALHRESSPDPEQRPQRLDHIGFIIDDLKQVDVWHDFLVEQGVTIKKSPKTHRDGARSFYCLDPDGTLVQLIYHPPLVGR